MSSPPPAPPAPIPGPVTRPRPWQWLAITSLVIALAAIVLAIVCWLRPAPSAKEPNPPAYTDEQVSQAKAAICTAAGKVDRALDLADAEPVSNDRTEQLAVAAVSRVTFDAGSRYLISTLAEEPGAPAELTTAVRDEANSLQELLIGFLNGIPNSDPAQQPAMSAANQARATVQRLCK